MAIKVQKEYDELRDINMATAEALEWETKRAWKEEQNIHKHHTQQSTVPNQNQTYQSRKAGYFMTTHNYSPGNQSTPKRRIEQYTKESLWMIIN